MTSNSELSTKGNLNNIAWKIYYNTNKADVERWISADVSCPGKHDPVRLVLWVYFFYVLVSLTVDSSFISEMRADVTIFYISVFRHHGSGA